MPRKGNKPNMHEERHLYIIKTKYIYIDRDIYRSIEIDTHLCTSVRQLGRRNPYSENRKTKRGKHIEYRPIYIDTYTSLCMCIYRHVYI